MTIFFKVLQLLLQVLLVPAALTFGLGHFSGKGWRLILEGQFWLGILGAAIPWAIAIPVTIFVVEKMAIHGDGKAAAGVGAIMGLVIAIGVTYVASFFVNLPEGVSSFSYYIIRSSVACVVIYGLLLAAEFLPRLSK